ncbi:TPA: hypothetical protein DDW35_10390, partial [Candidatus Sumerlaeota bacterium]|nr:hypothetical protein [Candidatus Sumerlaeota bacterium]
VDVEGPLGEFDYRRIGKPKKQIIREVVQAKRDGHQLMLWTCRTGRHLHDAVAWCAKHGLEFDKVNENLEEHIAKYGGDTRKIFYHRLIDDCAVHPYTLMDIPLSEILRADAEAEKVIHSERRRRSVPWWWKFWEKKAR